MPARRCSSGDDGGSMPQWIDHGGSTTAEEDKGAGASSKPVRVEGGSSGGAPTRRKDAVDEARRHMSRRPGRRRVGQRPGRRRLCAGRLRSAAMETAGLKPAVVAQMLDRGAQVQAVLLIPSRICAYIHASLFL